LTLASRITDLVTAIATAINTRAPKVGASTYDLAVINGYTGTQAQFLAQNQIGWFGGPQPWSLLGLALTTNGSNGYLVAPGQVAVGGYNYVRTSGFLMSVVNKPTTNSAWNLIVLRLTWNTNGPISAAITEIAGPTVANTTVPTAPPNTLTGVNSVAGVMLDVPLAWIWSTQTTSKAFDARLTLVGATQTVANPQMLDAYTAAYSYIATNGSILGMRQFDGNDQSITDGSGTAAVFPHSYIRVAAGTGTQQVWVPLGTTRVTNDSTVALLGALWTASTTIAFVNNDTTIQSHSTGWAQFRSLYNTTTATFGWYKWNTAWTAFTPADGFTAGTGGTRVFSYQYVAGRVRVRGRLTFGTSPALPSSGYLQVPLPVNTSAAQWFVVKGRAAYRHVTSPVTEYDLPMLVVSTGAVQAYAVGSNGTYTQTLPFTLTAGDYLDYDFEYDAF
jgi:hypothetical protein